MASLITRLVSITVIISAVRAGEDKPCDPKQFDYDSVVCVCTEDYCDYINPELPSSGQYLKVSSDKYGDRFAYSYEYKGNVWTNTSNQCTDLLYKNSTVLEVKRNQTGQNIIGFGGAINDAFGINMNNISEKMRDVLMESYFGADGLKYNMIRTTIGHCDYSPRIYYYTNETNDVDMKSWNLTDEDYFYRIPYLKQANEKAQEEVLITASLWTVPEWMREKSVTGQNNKVKEEFYDAYSLYIIKYLEAFKKEGINFWGVSYADEPTVAIAVNFADEILTVWGMNKLASFVVEHFGPALKEYGFDDTKIIFFDDLRTILLDYWVAAFFKIEGIEEYVNTISIHSYLNDFINTEVVDNFHSTYPNVTIITGELCAGLREKVQLGAWSRAEFYASNYLEELNHHHSAWLDWSMATDEANTPNLTGGTTDVPIVIMAEENSFYKQPSYYAIGHFSKWMPRGSTYVTLESEFPTDLEYGAVIRPDGLITAVVQNKSNHTINLTIKDMEGDINVEITPHSITTLLF